MSGPFGSSQWMYDSGYEISNSLRMGVNADLDRTPDASNRRTYTLSAWIKRGGLTHSTKQISLMDVYVDTNNFTRIVIESDDKLQLLSRVGNQNKHLLQTSAVLRDPSSWYHILVAVDTTNGTANDRGKIYINGVESPLAARTNPDQNYDGHINAAVLHDIGKSTDTTYDGYLAEYNFIDGLALGPSSFGETGDYGEWKPIRYGGAYGTEGFYLDFKSSGVGTAGTGTVGADRSGNGNHYTSSNIATHDQMIDSPTNNYATLNPLGWQWSQVSGTLTEGNLLYGTSGSDWSFATGTQIIPKDKKIYFEVRAIDAAAYVGIMLANENTGAYSAGSRPDGGYIKGLLSIYTDADDESYVYRATTAGTALGVQNFSGSDFNNAVIGVAVDQANSNVKFFIANSQITSQSPSNVFDTTSDYIPVVAGNNTVEQAINFGQDSSFSGAETAQGNTDANGHGDFFYAPPAGYLALCTKNLSEPEVVPSEYFNTILYVGNDSNDHSITGVGFQPDFTWFKNRGTTDDHQMVNAVRGQFPSGNGLARHFVNRTDLVELDSTIEDFAADGFILDGDNTGYNGDANNYVAWNWKANGAGSSGTTDTGALAVVNSAVPEAGFSIVTWTGNMGVDNISHGLSKAPEMMWLQNLSNANTPWVIWHKDLTADKMMAFNTSTEVDGYGQLGDDTNITVPTSTYFTVGNSNTSNATGKKIVNYCFHSVEGYCKVDSFISRQNTDGPFVYTGFKPAFVLAKMVVGGTSWRVMDNRRAGENQALSPHFLKPSDNNAEVTNEATTNFHANGFKMTFSGDVNYGTYKVIFIAFAETPFKYANAQ